MDENLPFEIGFEKAKNEITVLVNRVSQKYSIPSSLIAIILADIAKEAKLNTYETIIANYDISLPKQFQQRPKQEKKEEAPEVVNDEQSE